MDSDVRNSNNEALNMDGDAQNIDRDVRNSNNEALNMDGDARNMDDEVPNMDDDAQNMEKALPQSKSLPKEALIFQKG